MEVEFVLRADDVLAFHEYYLKRQSRGGQRQWLVPVVCLLLTALVWYGYILPSANDITLPLGLTVLFIILTTFSWAQRRRLPARILSQLRRQLDDEWNKKLIGWRRLSLTPESMTYTSKLMTASAQWQAVEQIILTEDHAFFFTTRTSGFVLPAEAFSDEEAFREFVQAARRYRRSANAEAEEDASSRGRSRVEETGFTAEGPAGG
jgi:hypothetical protein